MMDHGRLFPPVVPAPRDPTAGLTQTKGLERDAARALQDCLIDFIKEGPKTGFLHKHWVNE